MKPTIDTQNVGELIRQLEAPTITPTRFNVELPPAQIVPLLTAAYRGIVGERGQSLCADTDTVAHIDTAARWLAAPTGKPGLMLYGLYGNGKTTLMRAIARLIRLLYDSPVKSKRVEVVITDAKAIAEIGADEKRRGEYQRLKDVPFLIIDELGEEAPEVMVYGRVLTPVRDLLEERYRRQGLTIVATNLVNTPDNPQLSKHYGERVVDRFREMMEIIPFRNPSYRVTAKH